MSDTWTIRAFKYAERAGRSRAESFLLADDHALPHPIDYFVWILDNGLETILVDTGYDTAEAARRGRPVLADPVSILAQHGIAAREIETVILTHLHYDHAGGLAPFAHATLHVQAADMAYATGPCMCHETLRMPFTGEHIGTMVRALFDGRVRFAEGAATLRPGVEVHWMGGHSRGLQAVRVRTPRGWVVLASDTSHFYENFATRRAFPIVVDVEDALAGFDRLYALADSPDHIIPGHDPLVMQAYPTVSPDAVLLSADPLIPLRRLVPQTVGDA